MSLADNRRAVGTVVWAAAVQQGVFSNTTTDVILAESLQQEVPVPQGTGVARPPPFDCPLVHWQLLFSLLPSWPEFLEPKAQCSAEFLACGG